MTEEKLGSYCDDEAKCKNIGIDCAHCTRSWYYEETSDCFVEVEDEA